MYQFNEALSNTKCVEEQYWWHLHVNVLVALLKYSNPDLRNMRTIPKTLSSNQNDLHVNMIKKNIVNFVYYCISHKIMIKYWQNAIGSIKKALLLINTAKTDHFFETSYDATTKPNLKFSVVVPKLSKQKVEKPPTNVRFSLKDFKVW